VIIMTSPCQGLRDAHSVGVLRETERLNAAIDCSAQPSRAPGCRVEFVASSHARNRPTRRAPLRVRRHHKNPAIRAAGSRVRHGMVLVARPFGLCLA